MQGLTIEQERELIDKFQVYAAVALHDCLMYSGKHSHAIIISAASMHQIECNYASQELMNRTISHCTAAESLINNIGVLQYITAEIDTCNRIADFFDQFNSPFDLLRTQHIRQRKEDWQTMKDRYEKKINALRELPLPISDEIKYHLLS